jgi:AraC-like DNA-binding protein
MDVLAEVLAVSGVRGTVGTRVDAAADWAWWFPQAPSAAFHAVTAGTMWVELPGQEPMQLMPGDVLLLPGGSAHALAGHREGLERARRGESDSYVRTGAGTVRLGEGPTRTHVLCAHYAHDPAVATQVLETLPEVVHLRADHAGGALDDTVRLLAREMAEPQLATNVVVDRLVDILLVQLLRAWLDGEQPVGDGCWMRVLGDPVVGTAIAKLHEDPARAWTTEALASEVSVSRATLARRFPELLGETPAAYLTRWRMDLAALRLRDTDDPLETVAQAVGYTSVHAFSRAFSRARGEAPGRFRVTARVARAEAEATAAADPDDYAAMMAAAADGDALASAAVRVPEPALSAG